MRKVYILPNLFTSASLILGVLAIFKIIDGAGSHESIVKAIHYIIVAGFLDLMDGKIARLTGTESQFGLNYDSLADLISFGVAPAVIIYAFLKEWGDPVRYGVAAARGVAALYVLCGALRLARFNVQAKQEEKNAFLGIPIPAGAAVVLSFALFVISFQDHTYLYNLFPGVVIGTAWLMVSNVRFLGSKSISFKKKTPFQTLVMVVFIFALLLILLKHFNILIFPVVFTYVAIFLGKYIWRKIKAVRKETLKSEQP